MSFGDLGKNHDYQTPSAKELKEGPHSLSPKEQNYRAEKTACTLAPTRRVL